VLATGPQGGSTPSATSAFAQALSSLNIGGGTTPTYTNTTYVNETSQPDIEAMVNGLYQQLLGRYATPEEIKNLGSQLIAAQKENVGQYTGSTSYQASGKRADVVGTQVSTGVNPQAFLTNLIQGTAGAQEYKAATGYFQAMMSSLNEFKGAYNG
jgi:uncharacterized protein YjbJ (UPF0337 family)